MRCVRRSYYSEKNKEVFVKAKTGGCCHLNYSAMPQSWIPCQLCIGYCQIEVLQHSQWLVLQVKNTASDKSCNFDSVAH